MSTASAEARPSLDLIGRDELARQLDVGPETLRAWIKKGIFPPGRRIGQREYWRRSAIEAILGDPAAELPEG